MCGSLPLDLDFEIFMRDYFAFGSLDTFFFFLPSAL
jgi:hypothetical protein